MFVSHAYKKKVWPKHELRQAQDRAQFSSTEYILSVIIDDVELPGLTRTTGFLDARKVHPLTIAGLVMRKLGAFDKVKYDRTEIARLKKTKKPDSKKRVRFAGTEIVHYWPPRIYKAQVLKHLTYHATVPRIPYGDEFTPGYDMKQTVTTAECDGANARSRL